MLLSFSSKVIYIICIRLSYRFQLNRIHAHVQYKWNNKERIQTVVFRIRGTSILTVQLLISIRLISNWTLCRTIQGVIVLVNSNRCLVRFGDYSPNCSLNCTLRGLITIINRTRIFKSASDFVLASSRHSVSWGAGSAINGEQKNRGEGRWAERKRKNASEQT